ncbi:MAG: hypothetical protein HQM16_09990 [Deltaproteobacteria bacterium]|nr:hypothetical protein [Deltaproteobacteria bacterium]
MAVSQGRGQVTNLTLTRLNSSVLRGMHPRSVDFEIPIQPVTRALAVATALIPGTALATDAVMTTTSTGTLWGLLALEAGVGIAAAAYIGKKLVGPALTKAVQYYRQTRQLERIQQDLAALQQAQAQQVQAEPKTDEGTQVIQRPHPPEPETHNPDCVVIRIELGADADNVKRVLRIQFDKSTTEDVVYSAEEAVGKIKTVIEDALDHKVEIIFVPTPEETDDTADASTNFLGGTFIANVKEALAQDPEAQEQLTNTVGTRLEAVLSNFAEVRTGIAIDRTNETAEPAKPDGLRTGPFERESFTAIMQFTIEYRRTIAFMITQRGYLRDLADWIDETIKDLIVITTDFNKRMAVNTEALTRRDFEEFLDRVYNQLNKLELITTEMDTNSDGDDSSNTPIAEQILDHIKKNGPKKQTIEQILANDPNHEMLRDMLMAMPEDARDQALAELQEQDLAKRTLQHEQSFIGPMALILAGADLKALKRIIEVTRQRYLNAEQPLEAVIHLFFNTITAAEDGTSTNEAVQPAPEVDQPVEIPLILPGEKGPPSAEAATGAQTAIDQGAEPVEIPLDLSALLGTAAQQPAEANGTGEDAGQQAQAGEGPQGLSTDAEPEEIPLVIPGAGAADDDAQPDHEVTRRVVIDPAAAFATGDTESPATTQPYRIGPGAFDPDAS